MLFITFTVIIMVVMFSFMVVTIDEKSDLPFWCNNMLRWCCV